MQITKITNIYNNLLTVIDNLVLIYQEQSGTLKKTQIEYITLAIQSIQEQAESMEYLLNTLVIIEKDVQHSSGYLTIDSVPRYIHKIQVLANEMLTQYLEIASILTPKTVYSILNTDGTQAVSSK